MKTSQPSQIAFDDRNRQRAHDRLGAVDGVGGGRLRDPMWPAEDERRRRPRRPAASVSSRTPPAEAAHGSPPRVPLRLRMSTTIGRGVLDGAWWPLRVVYSPAGWAPAPRWINVTRGKPIRAGSFPGPDTQRLLLQMGGDSVLQLMVVPPELGSDLAERAMTAASSPANRLPALTLIAEAAVRSSDASRWDGDGGHTLVAASGVRASTTP